MEANKCRCGMPAVCGQDWCRRCLAVRDREVMHCQLRIRSGTGIDLSCADVNRLILSYFKEEEYEKE